ncbi:hypothetical protein BBJ29_003000 [Phytophthora kernoviae]|uniref:Kinesin motor domain-containing protein n=1 Tax=Phytophthora kernoviae TaxID=325452 RepID=A0A3F2S1T2_9STRA|nr:hypothetical protein BBJ29_003000 [Phytophthora kernoviae]RLN68712.1 hypothetical protein BBP00_00000842 [Phytophthora kernoviae]
MFAMISPASDNYDETMSTLRYAESAKKVMNRAVVNEDKNARIIRQLRQEIEELRTQLSRKEGHPAKDRRLSASLEEREVFYAELQKEVDFFRSQQKKVATSESPPAIHLNDDLPSLVNMNTNMGSFEALAYVLVEGTTVFGTDPRPDMEEFETMEVKQDDDKAETNNSADDESTDKSPPEQKKKKRHVPGCAVSVPRIAEAVEQPVEVEFPKDNGQDLETLVNEANAICEKWVLSTEFAVGKDPSSGDTGKETIIVTKKLEANCCSTVHWDRAMLEMKLHFLREFAASLENAVSFTNVAEELPKEEEWLEAEIPSKVDIPRQPSHSSGKEQSSSPVEEKPRADKREIAGLVHYIKPRTTHSLRYLGHGRIYLAAQSMGSSVSLSVAIYDFSGVYIGMLETQLEGVAEVQKRGVLSARSTTSMHRIRVRLNKMEFAAGNIIAASDISITLKETSSKAKVKAKNADVKKMWKSVKRMDYIIPLP